MGDIFDEDIKTLTDEIAEMNRRAKLVTANQILVRCAASWLDFAEMLDIARVSGDQRDIEFKTEGVLYAEKKLRDAVKRWKEAQA